MKRTFPYDVALSFAGEDREYVRNVAGALKSRGVDVFFDEYEQVSMWGGDLYEHLHDVYSSKARYCVIFISASYAKKIWTTHERKSAQARALSENYDYILPARFDSTELPGLRSTTNYIDLSGILPERLADLIIEKIGTQSIDTMVNQNPDARLPRTRPTSFNPYQEAEGFISYLETQLNNRSKMLEPSGASITIFSRGARKCFRLVRIGKPLFSLDVWSGGFASDQGISFFGIDGEIMGSSSSINATADVEWSINREEPVLVLHNISLFTYTPQSKLEMTYDEFIEKVWDRMIDRLEQQS